MIERFWELNLRWGALPEMVEGTTYIIDGGYWEQLSQVIIPENIDIVIANNPNLTNITPPSSAVTLDNYQKMQVDYCYWAHVDEDGHQDMPLPVEPEECPHVHEDDVYEVTVAGETVRILDEARRDIIL